MRGLGVRTQSAQARRTKWRLRSRASVPHEALPEPTNAQIENCFRALGLPMIPGLMDRSDYAREAGLRFHRLLVAAMNGDDAAAAQLERVRQTFRANA
jgi:hypothetical protein